MGARDAGWIQLFSENAQEAYENTIQAVRIAEHLDVRLPVMVMQDGFITSHGVERVDVYEDEDIRDFLGDYIPLHPLLDLENPVTYGPLDFYDFYYEHKRQQVDAMEHAPAVIKAVGKEWGEKFGREYGMIETYKLDDADVALVVLSSTAGTARVTVDRLREQGLKVGMLKPRVFRPFPVDEIVEALRGVKAVAVMDRSISFGALDNCGPLWLEIVSSAYTRGLSVPIVDYIFGLGGRDTTVAEIEDIYRHILSVAEAGKADKTVHYVGVRGEEPLPILNGNGHRA
jgi:pyruvate ferredoxin oxidoreductase alpha subunit